MELHTMGVGSGYTQHDVEELARILTGVGVDANPENPHLSPELEGQLVRNGLFEFNPAARLRRQNLSRAHDQGPRFSEVDEALDILARHPATAHHIALRIATYFVADDREAAYRSDDRRFSAQRRRYRHCPARHGRRPEFASAQGGKFKDPLRYVLSAVRLAYDDKLILNTGPIKAGSIAWRKGSTITRRLTVIRWRQAPGMVLDSSRCVSRLHGRLGPDPPASSSLMSQAQQIIPPSHKSRMLFISPGSDKD